MHISTRKLLVDYDEDSDTLYLYAKEEKVKSSIDFGNVLVDFGHDGDVVGLEFLNSATTLPPLLVASSKLFFKDEKTLNEAVLKQLNTAHVSLDLFGGFAIISFAVGLNKEQIQAKITLPVPTSKDLERAKMLAAV